MKMSCVFVRKRNITKLILRLLPCMIAILFLTQFLSTSSAQAIVRSRTIRSKGNIFFPPNPSIAPSPTTTPTLLSENLVVIPDSFMRDINYYDYASVDYEVTHNGNPSLRLDADYVRGTREVNCIWTKVEPGDHIVWSVWCKISGGVSNTPYTGGRIGLDLIGDYVVPETGQQIWTVDALPRDYTTSIDGQWRSGNWDSFHYNAGIRPAGDVYPTLGTPLLSKFKLPFGTSNDWVQLFWEFTVPDTYYSFLDGHPSTQITIVGPWIDARELTYGTVWFADSEFYINP